MKFFKNLNSRGFAHIEAALIIIVLVGIGGTYLAIEASHAAPCLARNPAGGCEQIAYFNKVDPSSSVYTNLDNVNFSGSGTSIDPEACLNNNQVLVYMTIPRLAGQSTTDKFHVPVQIRQSIILEDSATGQKVNEQPPYVIVRPGSGYNPIALYQVNKTGQANQEGPQQTNDGWYFTSKTTSATRFSFSVTPGTSTFRLGIEGYFNHILSSNNWTKWTLATTNNNAIDKCT